MAGVVVAGDTAVVIGGADIIVTDITDAVIAGNIIACPVVATDDAIFVSAEIVVIIGGTGTAANIAAGIGVIIAAVIAADIPTVISGAVITSAVISSAVITGTVINGTVITGEVISGAIITSAGIAGANDIDFGPVAKTHYVIVAKDRRGKRRF